MNRKKKIFKKIKKIIIHLGCNCEVFELTSNEKFKCSKKEVKDKCKDISMKIDEFLNINKNDANNHELNLKKFGDEKELEERISDTLLKNFSKYNFDEESFNEFDQI